MPSNPPSKTTAHLEEHKDTEPPPPQRETKFNEKKVKNKDQKQMIQKIGVSLSPKDKGAPSSSSTGIPSRQEYESNVSSSSFQDQDIAITAGTLSRDERPNQVGNNDDELSIAKNSPLRIDAQTEEPPSPQRHSHDEHSQMIHDVEHGGLGLSNDQQSTEAAATTGGEEQQGPQIFTVSNAFRVLTAEEQRLEQLERERQNYPLIEGRPLPPRRRPSDTPSQQEAKQREKENFRAVVLFIISAIVLVIVLVPSLVLTTNNKNTNNSNLVTVSPSPSSNPSSSLMPSLLGLGYHAVERTRNLSSIRKTNHIVITIKPQVECK